MSQLINTWLRPQRFIAAALSITLIMSLTCSMSMQYGHADVPIAASAEETRPLQAGQSAPRFEVRTVDEQPFVFDPRALDRPVVLITFRGGWCPFCNMHLSELRNAIPEINALGVDVLFLSGDRPELLYASLEQETQETVDGLGYTILSDAHVQAAVALGIAFKASQTTIDRRLEKNQDIAGSSMLEHGILAVPSVFAIDRSGIIAFVYSEPDYKVRIPTQDLLQVAGDLAAAE